MTQLEQNRMEKREEVGKGTVVRVREGVISGLRNLLCCRQRRAVVNFCTEFDMIRSVL